MKHDPRSDLDQGFCAVGGGESKSGRPAHCFGVKETLYPERERAIYALKVLPVYLGIKGKEAASRWMLLTGLGCQRFLLVSRHKW